MTLEDAQRFLGAGYQIKAARKDRGFTLNKLGRSINSTHSRVCYLEGADDANPTLDTMNKIAKALNLCLAVEFLQPHEMIQRAEVFVSRRRKRAEEMLANQNAHRLLDGGDGE